MNKKNLFWIIPSVIVVILLGFLASQQYSKPTCGDGICQENEVQEGISYCDLDCKEQCMGVTGSTQTDIEQECSVGWDGTYLNLIQKGLIDDDHIKETNLIDFSHPGINKLATELRRDTPKETAKAIAKWTYENIEYDDSSKYYDCRYVTASEILERKSGVCSTMSKLNIALLRANGIPAYSVTGCWKFNTACQLVQTFYSRIFKKFIEIKVDESGYAPTTGYLHNWVIVPLYENEEIESVILESTTGTLYKHVCVNYRDYYTDPIDSLVCGMSDFDPNLYDCKEW